MPTVEQTHLQLELRDYQAETIEALDRAWSGARRPSARDGAHTAVNRPAVVLPTGVGKTCIFTSLGARAHAAGGRALFLVHRDELAEQTAAKLRMSAPGAWVGVVKAERDEHEADLVVASVQTLARQARRERISRRGLLLGIADECHHSASPTHLAVMAHFGAFREQGHPGRVPWAGFTATLTREDSRGLGDVWEEVAYTKPLGWFIERGWLVPPVGRRIQVEDLDLARVKRSRGDLAANDLGDALRDAGAPSAAARAVLEHAAERRTAAFWPTVAVAQAFVDECVKLGIPAELVVGTTPPAIRREIYERFRTGETKVCSTAMVLCLDTDTEILTDQGWTRHDEMTMSHKVANWDQGRVFFEEPKEIIRRPLGPDEQMYRLETRGRSVRVTSGHRMLYRTHKYGQWLKAPDEQ